MMPRRRGTSRLIERLPQVRGRYREDAPLAPTTWFRVGGPAEVMFRPADESDLAAFLAAKPGDVSVTVLGLASNVLVRDGGIPGVVIRLGRGFSEIATEGTMVTAGAAALDLNVARHCLAAGVAGCEFLSGVPGTIGGAVRMNAGAYGGDMASVTVAARALDPSGAEHRLSVSDLGFSYRASGVPNDWIFTSATLQGSEGTPADIADRISAIASAREGDQPLRTRTGGSTFVNPPGRRAWELIEKAGCRGLRRGGAMVSEKHCNFLVNRDNATAAAIEALGEEVRRRVAEATGVTLEWEIRRLGTHPPSLREATS